MTFFIHKMNNQGCIEAERGENGIDFSVQAITQVIKKIAA